MSDATFDLFVYVRIAKGKGPKSAKKPRGVGGKDGSERDTSSPVPDVTPQRGAKTKSAALLAETTSE